MRQTKTNWSVYWNRTVYWSVRNAVEGSVYDAR